MKTLILSALMMLFAGGAFAADNDFTKMTYGYIHHPYVEPCPQTGPEPAYGGTCSEGNICPSGYEPKAKYCWNGGLEECGIVCRSTDPSFYDYL